MKVIGIVSEYNPFHNGHKYHIEASKDKTGADFVIAVISGNFLQRGEPAIINKWLRAKSALLCGVDMVIELPAVYSSSSAESFAYGAVRLLAATGVCDFISFGSESGEIRPLETAAKYLSNEPLAFKKELNLGLSNGLSFAAARGAAFEKATGMDKEILSSPNNILAIEYLKALKNLNSSISPVAIKRTDAGYNSLFPGKSFASARAIRHMLKVKDENTKKYMPEESYGILKESFEAGFGPVFFDDISHMLNYRLRTIKPSDLKEILDITEGMENRFFKSLDFCYSASEISAFVKSKRYALTKIQRAALHIVLDIKTADLEYFNSRSIPYIRVLGFSKSGERLLSKIKNNADAPLITSVSSEKTLTEAGRRMLDIEMCATDIYFSLMPVPCLRAPGREYKTAVLKLT